VDSEPPNVYGTLSKKLKIALLWTQKMFGRTKERVNSVYPVACGKIKKARASRWGLSTNLLCCLHFFQVYFTFVYGIKD
jgi:hypothetical protein